MAIKSKIVTVASILSILLAVSLSVAYFYQQHKKAFRIVNSSMAAGVTDKFTPVNVTEVFPEKTRTVFCWFEWKNAKVGMEIVAKWEYLTDEIHILDYAFKIPRKRGSGSVSLTMPEGKTLPSGDYEVSLNQSNRLCKRLQFKVE
jgi:hypothetical protein